MRWGRSHITNPPLLGVEVSQEPYRLAAVLRLRREDAAALGGDAVASNDLGVPASCPLPLPDGTEQWEDLVGTCVQNDPMGNIGYQCCLPLLSPNGSVGTSCPHIGHVSKPTGSRFQNVSQAVDRLSS